MILHNLTRYDNFHTKTVVIKLTVFACKKIDAPKTSLQ